ncbi:competence type IV pilus minor pilin ComGF [Sporosarcina gallistercoris]|uniref:ComGF family competence protein n=1 Tax=Sporosarcina gallistercoris TaxID=2762245 RepID=A0ABR8PF58_9BACL|nr:competence type IV pilus minor pilin ComGF [Sporosarcina gallistercoris]MBD7906811.1 ComGF family competence protein [Sporosarcina gallistercoris]
MNSVRQESGYTLLESLLQLVIAAAFLHLLVLFLLFKESAHHQLADSQSAEWELFMVDLQADLSAVTRIGVNADGTVLTAYKVNALQDIEFSSVGGVIRRRIGSQGHVPLLTNVQKVKFIDEGPLLVVAVTHQDGTERQRRVAVGLRER